MPYTRIVALRSTSARALTAIMTRYPFSIHIGLSSRPNEGSVVNLRRLSHDLNRQTSETGRAWPLDVFAEAVSTSCSPSSWEAERPDLGIPWSPIAS